MPLTSAKNLRISYISCANPILLEGAKVIGDIYIANNVTVAAGAVVTKSCYEEGALLAGAPAKIIPRKTK